MATTDADVERFFPYERPYENQREAMARIREALADGEDVLFEGACGTGKTLAALAPALDVARETDRTVVITTNVHQQMRQFVEEARAIDEQEPLRAVVFRGKASMCHVDVGFEECQVLRENTRDLVEAERDRQQLEDRQAELLEAAQDGQEGAAEARNAVMDELDDVRADIDEFEDVATCEHYYRNLAADTDEFYAWLHDGVRTPEEIYEFAEQRGLCGYELLKEGLEEVDLVVCNYNHLLDPTIRGQFFRWLGRDPSEVVAVFDEAHNVERAARDHASRTLAESTLDSALDELAGADDARADRAANVLDAFRTALVAVRERATAGGSSGDGVGESWTDVPVRNEEGRDDLTRAFLERYEGGGIEEDLAAARSLGEELDERYETAYRRGETTTRQECQTLQAARFVDAYLEEGADLGRYPVAGVRRGADGEVRARAELYTCIPREVTADLFDEVAASVLLSATLRPFAVTADVLGLEDPVELAYGLTFPAENRRTFAVDTPPLFASERDDPAVQQSVTDALADVVAYTPGNALLFFPSYREAERYHDRLAGRVDATLYLDRPGERAEALRERFVADGDGALLTSLWGTLAEGVSFDGDDARTVAVVGVPYPRLDDRAEAVQEAYDRTFEGVDAGWTYAVEIPTIRKTRQALGRVLRSPSDVGVRALLDRRYTAASVAEMGEYSVHETFPGEERAETLDVQPEKLRYALLNFYGEHGAYGGDPPAP